MPISPNTAWRVLDGLAYSSLTLGMAAGVLSTAAQLAMGLEPNLAVIGIAVTGTLVVYNVDRLADVDHDRATRPARSAFVTAHRRALRLATALAAAGSLAFAFRLGLRPALLLAPIALLGLAHRRAKTVTLAKPAYVTLAWLVVVVALPTVIDPNAQHPIWACAILGCALLANAIACDVREGQAAVARFGVARVRWGARGIAALGIALGFAAPAPLRPLLGIPLVTLAALIPLREDERYGLVVVDGALILGAVLAIALHPR